MKKTTKPATGKETKAKAVTNVAGKPGQKLKAAGDAKSKKAASTKKALPGAAKAKVGAVIKKTKTAALPKAKPPVKTKTATKLLPVKPPAQGKTAVKTSLKKVTVAAAVKVKTAAKTLKATAPKKATPKSALKGPEKKVLSPTRKAVGTKLKNVVPVIKEVRPATTKKKPVIAKEKQGAGVTKKPAANKNVVRAAEPAVKTRDISISRSAETIVKTKKVLTEDIKQPLKNKVPAKKALRSIKTEPEAKPLKEAMSAPRMTAKTKPGKPEEKPMKKAAKASAKSLPAAVKTTAARKEARPAAPAAIKGTVAETAKEPGRRKPVEVPDITAEPVKKSRIVMPAVPAIAEEDGEELLSVAEIEAREGYVSKPRLKIFLPKEENGDEVIKGKEAATGRASLPAEYGESEFFMIVIDPLLIFLDWEIMPGDLPSDGLHLCVRIYDVTALAFDGTNAHGFIDIELEGMTGSGYCELGMQGKEILAEIGYIDAQGKFTALMRSAKASVPPLLQHDELGIVRKMQEAGLPVGY